MIGTVSFSSEAKERGVFEPEPKLDSTLSWKALPMRA